ncbi:GAF domain-containing protein [Synechococcus sp. PCC 7502]|uniref:GAF domain-containing protein n=1 Tax=Synechococcus sp. PCC 7502 TaxID=1173263 RepID=UPI00029FF8FD|nr:GAF domain-containing protein [Synechococcus sp. PCC 7502]AFY75074.1 GAF domain-containing protein [Synechococcus sp. PCC 7502]
MAISDTAKLLEHIAKLEQENIALRTELGKFQERTKREKLTEFELVKANDALARSSARLAENRNLSSFLGYITQEVMSQLNANVAHLILFDEKRKVLSTAVLVENDGIIEETLIASEMPAEEAGFHKTLLEIQKPRFFDIETEKHLFGVESIAYLRESNCRQVLALPLIAGGKLFGHLAIAFSNNDLISKQKVELLQALGHQAALSIQLTNLAEEAKQGAIAHEQERAAETHFAELTQANQAIQRVLALMAKNTSLDLLLGNVLQAIAEQFDAPLVEWWESLDEKTVAKRLSYLNGQMFSGEELEGHHGVPSLTIVPDTLHMEPMTNR